MTEAPDVIYLYIPLMKDLNMSWGELKNLPRRELEGLLFGLSQYSRMHQFDGVDESEIGEMAKRKPQIRSDYYQYRELREKYEAQIGIIKKSKTPSELAGELKL
jgi:hypothetical protein